MSPSRSRSWGACARITGSIRLPWASTRRAGAHRNVEWIEPVAASGTDADRRAAVASRESGPVAFRVDGRDLVSQGDGPQGERARGTTKTVVVPIDSALVAPRDAYFAALDAYRSGELAPIVALFAFASFAASEESSVTAIRIRELPDQWLADLGRSSRGSAPRVLMDFLLAHPVLSAADAEDVLGSGTTVVHTAIERHEAAGILRPLLDELADLDARIQRRARSA